MRDLPVGSAFILLLTLSMVAGCSNHVDENTSLTADIWHQTTADIAAENQSDISAAPCNETRLDEVFAITRTEAPFTGRAPLVETNITQFVEESGSALKIPGSVPDGFFFHSACYMEGDDGVKKISLVFVNKSHEGYYVSLNASNQIYIMFSDSLDVEFREFIDQEPESICINGIPGFYYASSNTNTLRWLDGDIERWIVGPFDVETLVRIADSMGSPSEIDLNQGIHTGYNSLLPGTFPPGLTVPGTPIPLDD